MEVLLDSSFIISSVKRRIDFISQLESLGFKVILPREVYQELKDLIKKSKHEDREAIEVAMKIFDTMKVKKMTLSNVSVDKGLIDKGRLGYYIATLDSGIKRAVPNKVVISNAQNSLIIERD